jgi:leucyl-tRNA synthetase
VAAVDEYTNALYRYVLAGARRQTLDEAVDRLLLVMAPMAPHICAELWSRRRGGDVHRQAWPRPDPAMLEAASVTMVVQVDGKVRDRLEVPAGIGEQEAVAAALASEKVQAALGGRRPERVVARPPKLVNLVAAGRPARR